MPLNIKTLSITTLRVMTLSITTLNIITLSTLPLRITMKNMTIKMFYRAKQHYSL
jgi:hypothetical protein